MNAMKSPRSLLALIAGVIVAVAGLGAGSDAQARSDVTWSVGIGAPGVVIGATNGYGGSVYYAPPPPAYPVYPSYQAVRPTYYAPPPPVYYAPPSYGHHHHHHHHNRHHDRHYDRPNYGGGHGNHGGGHNGGGHNGSGHGGGRWQR